MARGSLKTDKELQDVGEARLILEGEIAALAAEHAENKDLERLESIMRELNRSITNGDRDYVDLDVEFHLAISQCAKNQMAYLGLIIVRRTEDLLIWLSDVCVL
jgi:DNA-binding FadR family transcriptional regulator